MASLYSNVGGSRKTISYAYTNISGTRKQIYPSILYVWHKYTIGSENLYSYVVNSDPRYNTPYSTHYVDLSTTTIYASSFRSCTENTSNGTFILSDRTNCLQATVYEGPCIGHPDLYQYFCFSFYETSAVYYSDHVYVANRSIYITHYNNLLRFSYSGTGNSCNYKYFTKEVSGTVEAAGSYIGEVTSTSASTYPNNGSQDGYWYVYQGSN